MGQLGQLGRKFQVHISELFGDANTGGFEALAAANDNVKTGLRYFIAA